MHSRTVQSLLRTAEALGVQHVHIVESVCTFQLPAAEARTADALEAAALCNRGCSPVYSRRYSPNKRYSSLDYTTVRTRRVPPAAAASASATARARARHAGSHCTSNARRP